MLMILEPCREAPKFFRRNMSILDDAAENGM
jgi:hypothetical protein